MQFLLSTTPGTIDLGNSTIIRSAVNNVSFLQQKNVAGSFVDILKLDAGDCAKMAVPLYVVAARAGAAATFPGRFATFQPISANSGDTGVHIAHTTITGSLIGFSVQGNPTTGLKNYIFNGDTATATAHSFTHHLVGGASGGDPFALFEINGVNRWSLGLDNSDSDAFVISNNANLGTSTALRIDTNLNVAVGNAALATSATDGFLYIPTCAGTPTGVPTTITGRIAMIYDTTNDQFWFYRGGWKQPKTPAAAAIITWQ